MQRAGRRAGDCAPYHWWVALGAICYMAVLGVGCAPHSSVSKAVGGPSSTYTNPVYAASMPDPSVIRYQGFYYAFGTTGKDRLPDGRIFTALRSRDLVKWETLGGALVPPSDNPRFQVLGAGGQL